MKIHRQSILLVSMTLLVATGSLFGQAGGSELTGKVLDQAGSAVVQARVTVTDDDTGLAEQVLTTSSGDYSFRFLGPASIVSMYRFMGSRRCSTRVSH